MRVVALVSGGKDSCYSMQLCKQHGHEVVALANLLPEESAPDELDSFCFQTVGHQVVGAYAVCMGLPLFRKRISGTSSVQDLGYSPTEGDEVEDLFQLLAYVKDNIPGIQAVASGAIASDYQRLRVENVCSRLNLVSLAYLWHQPQRLLLRGMVDNGVEAILIKVACLGLQPRKHLGRTIEAMEPTLLALADAYGCNVCGEGGEYETLTLDCPMFTRGRIELEEFEIVHGTSDVGYLVPKAFCVVPKPGWEGSDLPSDVRHVPHDYIAPPRFSRSSATPGTPPAGPIVGACASPSGASAAAAATAAAGATPIAGGTATGLQTAPAPAAAALDALLQPVAPSTFSVQVSMCTGPDYVQLVCRALRTKSALLSDITECDTTAALHALLTTAQQELAAQQMDLHHCLFVHLFLANMGHFQAANGVYCKHFSGRDPPSRACVQVCLPPDCPVMCEFLLARGSAPPACTSKPQLPSPSQTAARHTRRVLHVQSISSWAPSCIGPYSQATSYRGLVYLAGVIPLDPPVMTLVPGDITAQVLRAMTSCEAVAVAQRTTVVGAALGLTVYLAAAVGASSGGGVGGSGCGGGCGMERSNGSSGGAELRALARAAVEALLDHGLPGHPNYQHRQGGGLPGSSAGRYRRSFTYESTGLTMPRGQAMTTPGMLFSGAGVSAPGSRRAVFLGADGLDEEEEEQAEAAEALVVRATINGGTPGGGGLPYGGPAAASNVLDPYLQPPEVRNIVRPSVLYVTVPLLPRGSLVEIQPVCLDVEALSVIRKLAGHDSFVRRRNSSHQDSAFLHHSPHHHSHNHHGHPHAHHAHSHHNQFNGGTLGSVPAVTSSGTTTWSELPPTPRGSMESAASRDSLTYGSSDPRVPWLPSGEVLSLPLPSHVISAAGFMSPEAGSLAGTPSAAPSMLHRQRSSGLGLLPNGLSGSGLFNRCISPGPNTLALPHPPPSTNASGKELLSPSMQQLLQLQLPQLQAADAPLQPPAVPPWSQQQLLHQKQLQRWLQPQQHEVSGPAADNNGGGNSGPEGSAAGTAAFQRPRHTSSNGGAVGREALAAAVTASRASYSGSSGSSGPLLQRSSLDGNILSFEVSTGGGSRVPSSHGLTSPPFQPAQSSPLATGPQLLNGAVLVSSPSGTSALFGAAGAGAGGGGGGGAGTGGGGGSGSCGGTRLFARARPAAITVPYVVMGPAPVQPTPFESVSASAAAAGDGVSATSAAAAAAALCAGGGSAQPYGGLPPPSRSAGGGIASLRVVPPVSASSSSHGLFCSSSTPTPGSSAAGGSGGAGPGVSPLVEAATVPAAVAPPPSGGGGSSSSDVMVTTVCCYNQVLRSLFHLPPAVFAPGVTTAQLTRRFRRAAASVLAAHGMDMSCLIWVRVWYEKGSIGLKDDEFLFDISSASAGAGPGSACVPAAAAGRGGGGAATTTRVQHALEDEGEDTSPSGGSGGGAGRVCHGGGGVPKQKRGSGSGDSSCCVTVHAAAAAAAELGGGGSGGGDSPRQSSAVRVLTAATIATAAVPAGGGTASPRRLSSPAPSPVPNPPAVMRSPVQQPSASPTVEAGGQPAQPQHNHHHHHHHHHHQHQHHHHHSHHSQHNHQVSNHNANQQTGKDAGVNQQQHQQQQHFHVAWVPVQRVATNATPQPIACVAVLELLAALPTP